MPNVVVDLAEVAECVSSTSVGQSASFNCSCTEIAVALHNRYKAGTQDANVCTDRVVRLNSVLVSGVRAYFGPPCLLARPYMTREGTGLCGKLASVHCFVCSKSAVSVHASVSLLQEVT